MVNGSLERCHFPFQVGNRKYTECAPKNGKFFCQTGRRQNESGYCLQSNDEYLETLARSRIRRVFPWSYLGGTAYGQCYDSVLKGLR